MPSRSSRRTWAFVPARAGTPADGKTDKVLERRWQPRRRASTERSRVRLSIPRLRTAHRTRKSGASACSAFERGVRTLLVRKRPRIRNVLPFHFQHRYETGAHGCSDAVLRRAGARARVPCRASSLSALSRVPMPPPPSLLSIFSHAATQLLGSSMPERRAV